jgi:hypothetical protein
MRVKWEIDIDSETAANAARKALAIQRNHESITTVFDVTDRHGRTTRVDLTEGEESHVCLRQLRKRVRG